MYLTVGFHHQVFNYKLALTKSIASDWTTRHLPSASTEIAAIAADFQQPLRELGGVKALCAPGNLVGQVLDSWMFLGTDFMFSTLASPHV